jgi:XisH protein
MAARDLYYDLVRNALRQDGWRITHNPLRLGLPAHSIQASQREAAEEPLLAAEKDERKIAVLVKSFVGRCEVADLQKAVEHVRLYRTRLSATEPDRVLYLAVRQTTYREYFAGAAGARLLARRPILCIVFDPRTETIVRWNGLSPV